MFAAITGDEALLTEKRRVRVRTWTVKPYTGRQHHDQREGGRHVEPGGWTGLTVTIAGMSSRNGNYTITAPTTPGGYHDQGAA